MHCIAWGANRDAVWSGSEIERLMSWNTGDEVRLISSVKSSVL